MVNLRLTAARQLLSSFRLLFSSFRRKPEYPPPSNQIPFIPSIHAITPRHSGNCFRHSDDCFRHSGASRNPGALDGAAKPTGTRQRGTIMFGGFFDEFGRSCGCVVGAGIGVIILIIIVAFFI